jgi:hypothetical protein
MLATCIFLVLSWRRLYQFRPDLVSIPAAIAIYRLLLASRGELSWRRIGLATFLFWLWANAHSLFAVGLALTLAGWLGIWAKLGFEMRLPAAEREAPTPGPGRLGVALGLGFLAALLNPRGIEQHLTFLSSTRDSAIWMVKDEWTPFDPFSIPAEGAPGIDPLAWLTMDALLLLLVLAAAAGGLAFLRRPSAKRLRAADPVLGALAFASAAAILVSLRFLWMSLFILLFLLRAQRWALASRPSAARAVEWATAGLVFLLTLGLLRMDSWEGMAFEISREPGGYLGAPYLARRYCASGIQMLKDAGLQGNLFNPYHLGGYAGYRLAPRIRTFIDGRTEHYPDQVMHDYLKIVRASWRSDRRDVYRLLDAYQVDIFLGVGLPEGYYGGLYTVELVAGHPDWILIYRSVDHAIYLRRNLRNAENLWRAAEYYRERDVPFDSRTGFSARDVIRDAPSWAIAQGMISPSFPELRAQRDSEDPDLRFRALDAIGNTYWLLGDRRAQMEADRAALALRPDAREPRRRLANTYVRKRRFSEAERLARELYESDPSDARARKLYEFILKRRFSR